MGKMKKRWNVLLATGRFCFLAGQGQENWECMSGPFSRILMLLIRSSRDSENFARFVRRNKQICVQKANVQELFGTKMSNCQICSRQKTKLPDLFERKRKFARFAYKRGEGMSRDGKGGVICKWTIKDYTVHISDKNIMCTCTMNKNRESWHGMNVTNLSNNILKHVFKYFIFLTLQN